MVAPLVEGQSKEKKQNKTIELGKVERTETEGSSDPRSTLQAESPQRERRKEPTFLQEEGNQLSSLWWTAKRFLSQSLLLLLVCNLCMSVCLPGTNTVRIFCSRSDWSWSLVDLHPPPRFSFAWIDGWVLLILGFDSNDLDGKVSAWSTDLRFVTGESPEIRFLG